MASINDSSPSWHLGPLPASISLYAVAAAAGLVMGIIAWALKHSIAWVSVHLLVHMRPDGANWGLLVIPVAGILLAVAFQKWVARRRLGHADRQVSVMWRKGKYTIPGVFAWGPLVANVLTLGFGGSAGAEGPIATSGAALGSWISRRTGMPPEMVRMLIGCGAGAGIAAIFKAPVGGVLFTLEVLGMQMALTPLIALIISCLIAGMTCYGLTGFTLDVPLRTVQTFDPAMSWWIILLGVFCGFYSMYYRAVGNLLHRLFRRIANMWVLALVSGAILAVCLFLFPALYGEGYNTMANIIDGDIDALVRYSCFNPHGVAPGVASSVLVCLGVATLKPLACVASNSGGGVAGDFAPTLFAGCMAGLFFAGSLNVAGLGLPVNNFALCAMAAVMAGVIKAPLMAIFIVIEMTGYYSMTFPVMLAAGACYGTVLLLELAGKRLRLRRSTAL